METIFLIDTSKSMDGERIAQLNHVMLEILTKLETVSVNTSESVNVRVINFDNVARFFIGNATQSVRIDQACETWRNLIAKGATDTAHAVRLCKKSIECDYGNNNYEKTIVFLITDGESSDKDDFIDAINEMKQSLQNMRDKSMIFVSVGVFDYRGQELEIFADLNKSCKNIYAGNSESVYMADDIHNLSEIVKRTFEY